MDRQKMALDTRIEKENKINDERIYMFKVFIITCVLFPIPRGEIRDTKCYSVKDTWQTHEDGYITKRECLNRLYRIKESIKKNFDLYYIKKSYCKYTPGKFI